MKREHTFETVEHTADIGIIGRGKTMAEAFENTAYGMFSIIADLDKYDPETTFEVEAEGEDVINLLERFLSLLIIEFDAEAMLPLDFEITELSETSLKCAVQARKIRDDIEWIGPNIKAVTYHKMDIRHEDDQWWARAIFDV